MSKGREVPKTRGLASQKTQLTPAATIAACPTDQLLRYRYLPLEQAKGRRIFSKQSSSWGKHTRSGITRRCPGFSSYHTV